MKRLPVILLCLAGACGSPAPSSPASAPAPAPVQGSAAAPAAAPPAAVAGPTRIAYDLPQGWAPREIPGFTHEFLIAPPSGDFSPNLGFIDEPSVGTFAAYLDGSLAMMTSGFGASFRVLSRGEFRMTSGVSAARVQYARNDGGRDLVQTAYFVDTAPRRYVLTCTRAADDTRPIDAVCDAAARSFHLVSSAP